MLFMENSGLIVSHRGSKVFHEGLLGEQSARPIDVRFPDDFQYVSASPSPDGKDILWLTTPKDPEASTWERLLYRFGLSHSGVFDRSSNNITDVWLSRRNGSGLRMLGRLTRIRRYETGSHPPDPENNYGRFCWLPDSRAIAVSHNRTLYTIPLDH